MTARGSPRRASCGRPSDVCQAVDDANPGDSEPPGGCYAMAVHQALRQAQDQAGYPIVAWGYR